MATLSQWGCLEISIQHFRHRKPARPAPGISREQYPPGPWPLNRYTLLLTCVKFIKWLSGLVIWATVIYCNNITWSTIAVNPLHRCYTDAQAIPLHCSVRQFLKPLSYFVNFRNLYNGARDTITPRYKSNILANRDPSYPLSPRLYSPLTYSPITIKPPTAIYRPI